MNSFKGNVSFFKGWLNFSLFKVLELLPTKARHECFEILKLYIKLYIVHQNSRKTDHDTAGSIGHNPLFREYLIYLTIIKM